MPPLLSAASGATPRPPLRRDAPAKGVVRASLSTVATDILERRISWSGGYPGAADILERGVSIREALAKTQQTQQMLDQFRS